MTEAQCNEEAVAFEKEHGSVALLKVTTSTVCRLLIEKGICTVEEFQDGLLTELRSRADPSKNDVPEYNKGMPPGDWSAGN